MKAWKTVTIGAALILEACVFNPQPLGETSIIPADMGPQRLHSGGLPLGR